jgi:hypothetical protein
MSLRFQSAIQVAALPDEQIDNQFEVIMPTLNLVDYDANESICNSNTGLISPTGIFTYTPIVEEITFGTRNFKTATRRVRTGWCNLPDDTENWKDVSITMFCSAGMLTQYYLNAWKALVFNTNGEYFNPMKVYKKNIEVFIYGPGNVGVQTLATGHYTLVGCFPYDQDNYKLRYSGDPKRITLTQRFKVDRVMFESTCAKKAVIEELVTSPLSLMDKAVNIVMDNSGSTYNTTKTYE